MKNKTSPVKFLGAAMGTAASIAAATQSFRGRGQGMPGINSNYGTSAWGGQGLTLGAPAGQATGIGTQSQPVIDASTQFDDGTIQAAQGIFGNTNARQASLGSSGMMALEKHLSPVNNGTEDGVWDKDELDEAMHATSSINDKYAVDIGTAYNTKPLGDKILEKFGYSPQQINPQYNLTAYKPPNPPYDPKSGDDGAGGTEYDINK